MAKVMTKMGILDVPGGTVREAQGHKNIKDGETITTFRKDEFCDFAFAAEGTHAKHNMAGKTVKMHVLDAAIAQAQKKGTIVKGSETKYKSK